MEMVRLCWQTQEQATCSWLLSKVTAVTKKYNFINFWLLLINIIQTPTLRVELKNKLNEWLMEEKKRLLAYAIMYIEFMK